MGSRLLETIARVDLGAADRQICVDRVGPDGVGRRQLREVEGQERGVFAQLRQGRFDRCARGRAQFDRWRFSIFRGGEQFAGRGFGSQGAYGTANRSPTAAPS